MAVHALDDARAGAQEPAVGEGWARQDDAAKVHMAAPANTNVYVGNLPAEVGMHCLLH